jgi:Spy/CpxP family protein refolding chaperone
VTLVTLPPRRLRLLSAAVLAATFALGAIAGGGIYRWIIADRLLPADDLPRGPWPLHQLDLSDEQRARVRDIFERHRPELDALLRDSFPQVRAIHERIDSEIRELLTPEQRDRFDRIKKSRPFPPPGLPPPPGSGPRGLPPMQPPDRP